MPKPRLRIIIPSIALNAKLYGEALQCKAFICPHCDRTHVIISDPEGEVVTLVLDFEAREAEEFGKQLIAPEPLDVNAN